MPIIYELFNFIAPSTLLCIIPPIGLMFKMNYIHENIESTTITVNKLSNNVENLNKSQNELFNLIQNMQSKNDKSYDELLDLVKNIQSTCNKSYYKQTYMDW